MKIGATCFVFWETAYLTNAFDTAHSTDLMRCFLCTFTMNVCTYFIDNRWYLFNVRSTIVMFKYSFSKQTTSGCRLLEIRVLRKQLSYKNVCLHFCLDSRLYRRPRAMGWRVRGGLLGVRASFFRCGRRASLAAGAESAAGLRGYHPPWE